MGYCALMLVGLTVSVGKLIAQTAGGTTVSTDWSRTVCAGLERTTPAETVQLVVCVGWIVGVATTVTLIVAPGAMFNVGVDVTFQ